MALDPNRFGLSWAITTPMREGGAVDLPRLVHHARYVLANGCDSVTLFGTTGEGAALIYDENLQPKPQYYALQDTLALASGAPGHTGPRR